MKKAIWSILFLFFLTLITFAQLASDPNDKLYTWISIWEEKGYVGNLPLLRPYPIQLLREIFLRVMEVGNREEKALAEKYLKTLDVSVGDPLPDRSLPGVVSFSVENSFYTKFDSLREDLMVYAIIQGRLGELFTFSGKGGWGGMVQTERFYPPEWLSIASEAETGGGKAEAGDLIFWSENLGVGTITFGTPQLYLQAGLNRASFGPFFENGAVIGPQAPAAGHFSFTYLSPWVRISSVVLILHPIYYEKPDSELTGDPDNFAIGSISGSWENYLVVHSYTFTPTEWFELGIVQTVLLGRSANPVFALPFVHTFFAQMIYGDDNSSLIGLFTRIRLPLDLQFKFMLYVDDFNTDTFFGIDGRSPAFSLDNSQNKAAIQAGLVWTPQFDFISRMSLDYLMVTPYTYTHSANYNNKLSYTHKGVGVGTILQPNSDQITLDTFFQVASWLALKFTARYARHGNASEAFSGYGGDGSYYDDGYVNGEARFICPMLFLTQEVLEHVLQLGLDLEFDFGLGGSEFELGLGYLFEFVKNKGLEKDRDEINHFLKVFIRYVL